MKKTLCFILAFSCAFAFGGCTNKKTNTGGTPEIKWYTLGTKQVDQNKVMEKLNSVLEEKYNLKLDFNLVDAGTYNEKMNMVISSGEVFDLCYTSNWTNVFSNVVMKNGFMAIDEYINGDRKALYEALPDFTWEDTKVNGKIMAVPNYQAFYRQNSAWVPTKYIEKYNIDTSKIKSIYDMEPLLKALKDGEPDISPIMPQDFAGVSFNSASLMENVKKYDGIRDVPFLAVDDDYKIYNIYELPELANEYKLFREWYQKGYIRSDIVSAVNSKEDDTTALKYGVWLGGNAPSSASDAIQKYGEPVTIIPLAKPFIGHNIGQATMTAVSATSKQPNEALKLLEVMFTDKDTFNLLCYGIEGEHYEKISDKSIKLMDNGEKYNIGGMAWAYGNLFNSYVIEGADENAYAETDEINRTAEKSKLRGFSVNLTNVATEVAKVNSVKSEYAYTSLGAEDPEPLLKEFNEKLKTAGIDTVKEEIQKQLDEFVKTKNNGEEK